MDKKINNYKIIVYRTADSSEPFISNIQHNTIELCISHIIRYLTADQNGRIGIEKISLYNANGDEILRIIDSVKHNGVYKTILETIKKYPNENHYFIRYYNLDGTVYKGNIDIAISFNGIREYLYFLRKAVNAHVQRRNVIK